MPEPRPCFLAGAPLPAPAARAAVRGARGRRPRRAAPAAAPPPRRRARVLPTAAVGGDGPGGFPPPQKMADALLRAGQFFQSTNGQIVLWAGLVWLVLTGKIGVLFDSFLFLFLFVTIVPVVGLFVFRWWVASQTVEGTCPNCASRVSGLRGKPFQCMDCGQVVKGESNNDFSWGTEPSSATIDVDAVSVDGD